MQTCRWPEWVVLPTRASVSGSRGLVPHRADPDIGPGSWFRVAHPDGDPDSAPRALPRPVVFCPAIRFMEHLVRRDHLVETRAVLVGSSGPRVRVQGDEYADTPT